MPFARSHAVVAGLAQVLPNSQILGDVNASVFEVSAARAVCIMARLGQQPPGWYHHDMAALKATALVNQAIEVGRQCADYRGQRWYQSAGHR